MIDLDQIVAIDVHTHAEVSRKTGADGLKAEWREAAAAYFGEEALPTIVLAHPSFPWQDEAISVALHKSQVYIDLSGWSPNYFPPRARRVREHPAQAPRALRLRLPAADAGALARGLRARGLQGRRAGADPERERGEALPPELRDEVLGYFPVLGWRLRQRASTLSGGEPKMLTLAKALVTVPHVLVLDEISDGLGPAVVNPVREALQALRDRHGVTLLMVEQNLDLSLGIADRVAVLKLGRLIFDSPSDRPGLREQLVEQLAP